MEEARPERFVRKVGGELVSSVIARSEPIRVELLSRTSRPRMNWHFRQPELTLFWLTCVRNVGEYGIRTRGLGPRTSEETQKLSASSEMINSAASQRGFGPDGRLDG